MHEKGGAFTNSIKIKLIIIFLLVSLIPVIILGYLVMDKFKEELKNNFIKATSREIRHVDRNISLYFKAVKEDTRMLATNPIVKEADESLTTYMNKTKPQELQLTPLKKGGVEADIYEVFSHFAKNHSKVSSVYLGTKSGGYVQWPAISLSTKNYDPRKRPFYKGAMKDKDKVAITDPYYWSANDTTNVSVVTTVKDNNGRIIGVQGIDISLDSLTRMIEDIKIGETGYVIVTNNQGSILAHSQNAELNFKSIKSLGVNKLNNIESINQASFEAVMNGKNYFMNLRNSSQTNLKFIAVIEKKELTERVDNIYKIIFWIIFILTIIIIVISIFFSNKFTKPLIAATNFAREITDENLNVEPLKIERRDEIGELSGTLNDMKNKLHRQIHKLNLKNKALKYEKEKLQKYLDISDLMRIARLNARFF
ncbi:HAMP domain-containing protein [Selenihalanaerobacter shriftii]|uniref:histidine kinase n=1 Tax=Selenihalanaerobacter shriftii TaxID=142842 RepID=A0A1T4K9G6_9FIRM|nr:cache domain-containing protein [Selenihalanaerobacter shriftii]SJZ39090.1 HAMP domain-containing protein [Selenihalanaerobacter shriftii]